MKAILMSIRPQWVVKILNGEKTIEVRKHFPSDYVGWVYIYCTKGKTTFEKTLARYHDGKVVARFWCDKVEEIIYSEEDCEWKTKSLCFEELLNKSLTHDYLLEYLGDNGGYAIHITKLEIFDKPKEISEFYKVGYGECVEPQGSLREQVIENYNNALKYQLTRAPQSWCYIEV